MKMKKPGDRDIKNLERISAVTALLLAVLCVLYLTAVLRDAWVMNFILLLGCLMHLELALLELLRCRHLGALAAALLTVVCAGFLIYVSR